MDLRSGGLQRMTTEDRSVNGMEEGELFTSEDPVRSYGMKQKKEE